MKEFIDKLIERLEELQKMNVDMIGGYCQSTISKSIDIVTELAEEYKCKSNNTFETIYDKVCSLEKKYANDGNVECVNDCIKLENLLQYFKEELQSAEEYNGGWIPCSERLPEEYGEYLICNKYGVYGLGFPHKDKYGNVYVETESEYITEVIAWMPLPAPYTEGE